MKIRSLILYSFISSIFLFSLISIWKILSTLQGIDLKNFNFAIILSLGIGIDYVIHMWRRFESERDKRDDVWEALEETISTTGVALVLSAGTTALGFLVLLLSPMPVVQQFGLVTALTVTFSLVLSIIVLPVLLLMAENNSSVSE